MTQERVIRKMLVGFAERLYSMEPCVVNENASLVQMVKAVSARPGPQVVAVVDSERRLKGTISRLALAEEVLVRVMAEELLFEVADARRAMVFAHSSRAQLAKEIMGPPASVRRENTLREAFAKMHRHHLDGLPIVEEDGRVVGYLDVSALLLAWLSTTLGRESS